MSLPGVTITDTSDFVDVLLYCSQRSLLKAGWIKMIAIPRQWT